MNRGFLFKALLEGVDRVLEVTLLVLVLFLDVGVNFYIFYLLVLYIRIQVLIYRSLQQIEIIYELHCTVDGIGKAFNEDIVGSNL